MDYLSSSLAEEGDQENAVRVVELKYMQKVWKWSEDRQPDPGLNAAEQPGVHGQAVIQLPYLLVPEHNRSDTAQLQRGHQYCNRFTL